ncbi:hypothetical protein F5B18DRAFT_631025 [Nemania serpens]|nr:hypothetical protein F5B18DRAFT_631025 [Nemania serpens]
MFACQSGSRAGIQDVFSDLMLATTSSSSRSWSWAWSSCLISGWVSSLCSFSWSCPCSTFDSCSGSGSDAGSGVGSGVGSGSGSDSGSDSDSGFGSGVGSGSGISRSGLCSCSGTGFSTSRGCDSVILLSSGANGVPGPAGAGGPTMYWRCRSARIRKRVVTRNVTTSNLRGPRKVAIVAMVGSGIGLDSAPGTVAGSKGLVQRIGETSRGGTGTNM